MNEPENIEAQEQPVSATQVESDAVATTAVVEPTIADTLKAKHADILDLLNANGRPCAELTLAISNYNDGLRFALDALARK